ncbi:Endocytosis regulator [Saxophila tyrrhenica]|uniref:Endocytosis regulator n=1 Tax=Saxophila tyrrhenica TaxID=1690608 RepID=A0AAV9P6J5_9PEZI|nr:Endocytosis regulator [Saxophila tyrrhenica]
MPSKIFGVDLRLPQPQNERPGKTTSSATNSPASSRRGLKLGSSDKKNKERSLSKDRKIGPSQLSPSIQPKSVKLGMYMESPPTLFIGAPSQSSGVLMSGRLQVTPNVPEATLNSVTMYLECTTTTKRPVSDRCRECQTQINDLYEWHFFTQPKTFKAQNGMQELPFSHLIPGHLPATTHGQIGSLDYSLHVKAKAADGQEIEFRRELKFQRALLPGNEKNSVRIFPPTTLALHVTLPSVIHPIGEFPIQCRMTGITTQKGNDTARWRLRKLLWRIEEFESMVSPACSKHASKVGGEGKGISHENTREVGMDELKQGWKTDFDGEGSIEGEFNAAIDASAKPQCDVNAQNGLRISHTLIIELVIAEEWATGKKPGAATPTGAARVLRTQFNLNVTERAGMGLSWDDEQPPMYEDVPVSPPHYQGEHTTMTDYEGDDLHEDVEHLVLTP